MAKRIEDRKRTELGRHLVELRNRAGLSQAQLARMTGLPQRTIANYETRAKHIPSSVLPPLADALGVSIEETIGLHPPKGAKRGPKSRLEKHFEELQRLPKSEQELVTQVLSRLLAGSGRGDPPLRRRKTHVEIAHAREK
jgi:transcriptional regulator with XRE-family HTH domain